ncbi:MAG: ferritin-like domain-containing protein [Dichotomicrobium sp.]
MKVDDFQQMYLAELQEIHSAEAQLAKALPELAERASTPQLKGAFQDQLSETRSHLERMEDLLKHHGTDPSAHDDQSMQAIVSETGKWARMIDAPNLRDAAMIASAQRMAHYEIAVYGTLASWAQKMGLDDDAETLHALCEEEKHTDRRLTELSESLVDPKA